LRTYSERADGCPAELREAIEYALLGPGKRLRPMLAVMACQACGGTIEAALPAASAVEMIHAYSLVHDDLPAMDDDDLRRGRPTCHRKFGEATAILAGDALLTLAFEVLAKEIRPPELAAACCAQLAEAAGACNLVGGQVDDMAGNLTPGGMDALESIHHRKTGAIIQVSLRLGAMVAGADAAQITALQRYGLRLGLAFQITDDLLDVRGSQTAVGKSVGKVSHRGKLTFPGVLGVDRSIARAGQLTDEACEALAPLGPKAGHLEAMARCVLERDR
jgi:geranylgeranyl diphosphate synthase type II